MECVQIDLSSICRTCKNESTEMKSLSYRDSESGKETPRLDEMLMACTSVQVNDDDGLPKSICLSCLVQLKNAYSFKQQCEKTDLSLRGSLKTLKMESIREEMITDLDFTSNCISEINSPPKDIAQIKGDKDNKNNKDNPDFHSTESREKDVDYVQLFDSNLTIYKCRTCSKVFYTLEGLRSHKRVHTNNIEEHYIEVNYDDNTVTYPDQLQGGSGDDLVIDETMEPEVEISENNDQKKIDEIARIANDIYDESDGLLAASTHSEYIPMKQNEVGNFPCSQSKKVFPRMKMLAKHAEQHDGLRLYECDSCNKKFRRRDNLKQHKVSHMDVKAFVCTICGKCFKQKRNLQSHMKLHLNTEAHSCDLCNTVFNRPENLAKHKASMHNICEKITREKKNFLCSECGKNFSRKDDMMTHMKRHRGEKPFECKFCGKGFTRFSELTVHERYHTGEKTHVCGTCGKGFGRAYNLMVHKRTHTGEKPYRCTHCDAAFAQSYDLKSHVRRHTGERFQCELCPTTFLMHYLLTQHKRLVHGLNIVSNKSRLQSINKLNSDDPPPITVSDPLRSQQDKVLKLKQEEKTDVM